MSAERSYDNRYPTIIEEIIMDKYRYPGQLVTRQVDPETKTAQYFVLYPNSVDPEQITLDSIRTDLEASKIDPARFESGFPAPMFSIESEDCDDNQAA